MGKWSASRGLQTLRTVYELVNVYVFCILGLSIVYNMILLQDTDGAFLEAEVPEASGIPDPGPAQNEQAATAIASAGKGKLLF